MDIITRNLFRLIRAGAFNEKVQIEPMSAWKWRRAYQYALMHGLTAIAHDGVEKCSDQFFLQLPSDLAEVWERNTKDIESGNQRRATLFASLYHQLSTRQLRPILIGGMRMAVLYNYPNHRLNDKVQIFFPFQTQGQKADNWAQENGTHLNDADKGILAYDWNDLPVEHHHRLCALTNKLLNHQLQNIIEQELRESEPNYIRINVTQVETVSNTLTLLYTLIQIARHVLSYGIPLQQLTDLGILLREAGDKVDFVKLQNWIDKLRLKRIAHLSGLMLISLFNFNEDEIPFIPTNAKTDLQQVMNEMFNASTTSQGKWYFQQGEDIFVHATNSSAMMWHVQHSARYLKYYPAESITNFVVSFIHSLSHIEE